MVALAVAACGKIISEQSPVLDSHVNSTPFYNYLDFIGGHISALGMYGNALASICAVSAYLLVHSDCIRNHGFHGCHFFIVIENIHMCFRLARCVCGDFYSQVVIQTERTVVGVVEPDCHNRSGVVGINAHDGGVNGIAPYPGFGFRSVDAYRVCSVCYPLAAAEHVARIDGYAFGVTVIDCCFAQFLPFPVVEHFHRGTYG